MKYDPDLEAGPPKSLMSIRCGQSGTRYKSGPHHLPQRLQLRPKTILLLQANAAGDTEYHERPILVDLLRSHARAKAQCSRWTILCPSYHSTCSITLRLSGSPTHLNKEARSWRVHSKRLLCRVRLERPHISGLQIFATAQWSLWRCRQHAARSQYLLEIFTLMLKDNLGLTIINIQDERRVDLDVYRLRRRFLKAPYELSTHQQIMIVQLGFFQG